MSRKADDIPGVFEQQVLLAVMRLGAEAYGVTVRQEIEKRVARQAALGAVYATLERLEAKGYVSSREGGATAVRGGRSRRYFEVTSKGGAALQRALDAVDRLREGIVLARPAEARP